MDIIKMDKKRQRLIDKSTNEIKAKGDKAYKKIVSKFKRRYKNGYVYLPIKSIVQYSIEEIEEKLTKEFDGVFDIDFEYNRGSDKWLYEFKKSNQETN